MTIAPSWARTALGARTGCGAEVVPATQTQPVAPPVGAASVAGAPAAPTRAARRAAWRATSTALLPAAPTPAPTGLARPRINSNGPFAQYVTRPRTSAGRPLKGYLPRYSLASWVTGFASRGGPDQARDSVRIHSNRKPPRAEVISLLSTKRGCETPGFPTYGSSVFAHSTVSRTQWLRTHSASTATHSTSDRAVRRLSSRGFTSCPSAVSPVGRPARTPPPSPLGPSEPARRPWRPHSQKPASTPRARSSP